MKHINIQLQLPEEQFGDLISLFCKTTNGKVSPVKYSEFLRYCILYTGRHAVSEEEVSSTLIDASDTDRFGACISGMMTQRGAGLKK